MKRACSLECRERWQLIRTGGNGGMDNGGLILLIKALSHVADSLHEGNQGGNVQTQNHKVIFVVLFTSGSRERTVLHIFQDADVLSVGQMRGD